MTTYNTTDHMLQDGQMNIQNAPANVSFTIGTEATNAITVNIQLNDKSGAALTAAACVFAFLSDNATGLDVSGTAPDGGVASGTDGDIIVAHTAALVFTLQSETDGDIDIVITESGADTWYLVVVDAYGKQHVSDAITFAA